MVNASKNLGSSSAEPSSDAETVLICTSPRAGSGRGRERIPQLVQRLASEGYRVVCSDQIPEILATIRQTDPRRLRAVIPAGGDGTINLVADRTPPGTPLVPFPLGTENLLSRYFGFTPDPQATVRTVRQGALQRWDAGRANGKLFLVMASCGFDAEVVRAMHLTRRGHIGRWSYAKPIARAVRRYRYPHIRVRPWSAQADREGLEDLPAGQHSEDADGWDCRWAMVFNLPLYGGGLRIEPDAVGNDGLLDMCALQYGSTLSTLRYVAGVFAGRHHRWKDVRRQRARRWTLSSDVRVSYQLDGDYGGRLPLELECLPERLTLRVPPGAA
ncbi:diacylglycerol/lipid kinase family protein [Roseimaritima sediminicola]|uniref:diacylglycerol/lipid kinase family protein n=1 Tax=Roseimaritima sediminicola TaxID=2662066 RepID=UPI0012982A8A|nr:diacylglycerol kinase family protein [Roseimaritima sediminicola]